MITITTESGGQYQIHNNRYRKFGPSTKFSLVDSTLEWSRLLNIQARTSSDQDFENIELADITVGMQLMLWHGFQSDQWLRTSYIVKTETEIEIEIEEVNHD